MKMRLLTGLIAAVCFSQAASAADLVDGTVTNQTTATADVMFNQPITLENTLTPVTGLKGGQRLPENSSALVIANGKLAIKDSGVTARLALKFMDGGKNLTTYAVGHEGEDSYALKYIPMPKDTYIGDMNSKYDEFVTVDGSYFVTPTEENQLDYNVIAFNSAGKAMPGKYTISVTGAVYTP